jgi:hypothetical protein
MKTAKPNKMTQSRLAALLGVSRQLIAHHVKTGKAPKLTDAEAWFEHLAVNGREGSLPREMRKEIAQERLRLIRAQAERVEIENQEKRGETVQFSVVLNLLHQIVGVFFFGELERLAFEFPPLLKGKNEIEINEECNKQTERIKVSLHACVNRWVRTKGKK